MLRRDLRRKNTAANLPFSGSAHKTRLIWIFLPPAPACSVTQNTPHTV